MDPTLAIFRIEDIKNDALQTAASIALLVLGVLYLALIFWTFADARRRIDDPLLSSARRSRPSSRSSGRSST